MDEDEEFAKRFALKPIKPDERLYQVRYLRPELVKKLKEFLKKEKRYGKRKKIWRILNKYSGIFQASSMALALEEL